MNFKDDWKKYILRGACFLFTFILITVFLFVMILKTDSAHNFILTKVNTSIPGSITLEKLKFSILEGDIELSNVVLKDPLDKKMIGFDTFYVNFSWKDIFIPQITIETVRIEKPTIHLSIDEKKRLNISTAFPPPKDRREKPDANESQKKLPFNILVKSIKINDADFQYQDISKNFLSEVKNISFTANANIFQKTGMLSIDIGQGLIKNNAFSTSLDYLKINCDMKNGAISPLSIDGKTDFLSLSVNGSLNDFFNTPQPDISLSADIDLDAMQKNMTSPKNNFSGAIKLNTLVRGVFSNPDIEIKMAYSGGIIAGSKIENIHLDAVLNDRFLKISKSEVKTGAGYLKLTGHVDLKTAFPGGFIAIPRHPEKITYNLQLDSKNISLSNLPFLEIDKKKQNGTMHVNASAKGKGTSPGDMSAEIKCDIIVNNFSTNALEAPTDITIKAHANVENDLVKVSQIMASAEDTKLHGKGTLNTKTKAFNAKINLNAPHIEKPTTSFGLQNFFGKLSIDADISGEKNNIKGVVKANSENLVISEVKLGDIDISAQIKDNHFSLTKLHLKNQLSEFHANGTIKLFPPRSFVLLKDPAFKLHVEGEKLNINDFIDQYDGHISLEGDFSGTKNNPLGILEINIEDLDIAEQKIRRIHLPLSISEKKLRVRSLNIEVDKKETLTGDGFITFEKDYEISLVSHGISLNSISAINKLDLIDGILKLKISGAGNLKNPRFTGNIDITDIFISQKPFDDFHIAMSLENQLATVKGKLNFNIESSYNLDSKNFNASVLLDNTSLDPYFKIANQPDLNGSITGKIRAHGNTGAIDKIQGIAELTDFNLLFKNDTVITSQKLIAHYKNEKLTIPGIALKLLNEGKLHVSGIGSPNGPLDFKAMGSIPLHLISLFVEDLSDIKGNLNFDTGLKGTFKKPDMKGSIQLSDIQFTIPELYQKIHKLNGEIDITPEKIEIKNLGGFLDSGKFNLSGTAQHENLLPKTIHLSFNSHSLPIKVPDTLDMVLNSKLELSGNSKQSLVEGEIVLLEGVYYKDINLNPFKMAMEKSLTRKRSEAPIAKEINLPVLKGMNFDIDISRRSPFVVDNNLAFMEVNPDLNLTGSIRNPIINGRASVINGKITYQKRKFIVNKGVIDFINPYKIEPEIDIESKAQIRDWEIILNISGTPEELSFIIKSDPQEEENDILSLIMFGRTNRELVKGEGGTNLSTAQLVAQMVGATLGDDIKKSTGLDIFEVAVEGSNEKSSSENIKITMGEEITRRLTMKYELQSEEGEIIQRGISEYRFLENFYLNGYQDTKGDFGCQMLFKLEFR